MKQAFSVIAKTWNPSKCPLKGKWIKKMCSIHTMEEHSTSGKREILPLATTWMILKPLLLLLLLLSHFSRVRLCATPWKAPHQAPPSLRFSGQEHWSGLPFPSPMHETEKWKWSHSVVSGSFTTPWTAAYQAPPSMGFSRQEYWRALPLPSPSGHHVKPNKPAQMDKYCKVPLTWGFPGGSVVKNLPAMQETRVLSPR